MLLFAVIWFLINLNLTIQFPAVNVAFKKNVTFCDVSINNLNDGSKDISHEFSYNANCEYGLYLKISLEASHYIEYLIIFAADNGVDDQHPLDNLTIGYSATEMCGWLPDKTQMIKTRRTKGVRLNCHKREKAHDFVILSFSNPQLTIRLNEVEVYTFGTEEDPKATHIHRGCFRRIMIYYETQFSDLRTCRNICYSKRFTVMAISKPHDCCVCGYDFFDNLELPMTMCNKTCDGERCGGNMSFSVYILQYKLPHYDSCYMANNYSGDVMKNMTIQKCLRRCQCSTHVWIKTDRCSCRNSTLVDKPQRRTCTSKCAGDDESYCGGDDLITVYGTCRHTSYGYLPCSRLLHCKGGIYDKYGVCTKGCKSGFRGEYCMERVSFSGDAMEPDDPLDPIFPYVEETQEEKTITANDETYVSQSERMAANYKQFIFIVVILLLITF